MAATLGDKLSSLRREHGYTQETVAERLGVSPQAVSKWENDASCPDVMLLPAIAKLYGTTIDHLLGNDPAPVAAIVPAENRKPFEQLMLHINVDSADGDRVRVNLPMLLIKTAIEIGINIPQVSGNAALENVDLSQVLRLVESGLIGKIVEVQSADGDTVEIVVE
jgi:transcriptional regulator with XRE-family HTH domain